eukprot:c20091_g1_i1 orf=606-1922(-)
MISFRRSLSPSIHDRSLQNGTALPGSNHLPVSVVPSANPSFPVLTSPIATADLSSTNEKSYWPLSWLKFLHRRESYDRSKIKGSIWKRPFLPVMFCFFFGFLVGLMPFSSPNSVGYKSEVGQQEFSLEVKAHLQRELSNFGNKENQLEATEADAVTMNGTHNTKFPSTLPGQVVTASQLLDPAFGKLLIVVTPTYNRPLQALYLTRLSHTLKLVPPPLLWLVVEMPTQSIETATILRKTGVMYRHLVCKKNMTDVKDRGVHQRNAALAHIEQHQLDGIVYFADDDNVYSLELFEQMRLIKRFGTWPVAMLTASKSKAILEGPVCDGHTVVGWHTNEKSKRLRRFHVDMCGFAFNSTILWDPQRWRRPTVEPIRQLDNIKEGFQETTFIEQLVEDESQMEGLPSGCSKVMVWHLHFEAPELVYPPGWRLQEDLNATILL